MSKYTTGELAKLCGVTVRTVQYYDSRNILVPSQLSEGGRRLYSEDDLQKMRIICFLRELDLPLNTIAQLLSEAHPENTIELLLEQQEQLLRSEIAAGEKKLGKLTQLKRELRVLEHVSVESIGDIAYRMENKSKLRKIHAVMLGVGIPLEILEGLTFLYALLSGIWWPYLLGLAAVITGSIWLVQYYYKNVKYLCPQCHTIFRPGFWEMLFARHTPSTRRITCNCSGKRAFVWRFMAGMKFNYILFNKP